MLECSFCELGTAMKYKLLALDIDGTLVGSDDVVPAQTVAALAEAQRAGMRVCIATGRDYDAALPVWRQLKLAQPHEPLILVGGALVSEAATGRTLYQRTIERETARQLGAAMQRAGYCVMAAIDGWRHELNYFLTAGGRGEKTIHAWFARRGVKMKITPTLAEETNMPNPLRISIVTSPTDVVELEAELKKEFDGRLIVQSIFVPAYDFTVLEAFATQANKHQALTYIAQSLRIGKGMIAAVGDDVNDLPMLKGAGLGVAMPAAPEVVKKASRRVAEGGLTRFIHELVAGKYDDEAEMNSRS